MKLSLRPDEVVGAHEMLRWYVVPPMPWLAVYIHKHQANDPRFLHDHPSDNVTIRLRGRLIEYFPRSPTGFAPDEYGVALSNPEGTRFVYLDADGETLEVARMVPRIHRREAEDAHRLELPSGETCWTLWIRFRARRPWGYFEPKGWRRRRDKPDPTAAIST